MPASKPVNWGGAQEPRILRLGLPGATHQSPTSPFPLGETEARQGGAPVRPRQSSSGEARVGTGAPFLAPSLLALLLPGPQPPGDSGLSHPLATQRKL